MCDERGCLFPATRQTHTKRVLCRKHYYSLGFAWGYFRALQRSFAEILGRNVWPPSLTPN